MRRMDLADIQCWLYANAGDTLRIDDQRLDLKVYHTRAPHLSDAADLSGSGSTLDRYTADVVSSGRSDNYQRAIGEAHKHS